MQTIVDELVATLTATRARTLALVENVPDALLARPAEPCMGPMAWDLAHVAWFEELWLLRRLHGLEPEDPRMDARLDAARRTRAARTSPPTRAQALGYLARVRERVLATVGRTPGHETGHRLRDGGFVYRMIVQHETQHQETLLQALQLACATHGPLDLPIEPMSRAAPPALDDAARVAVDPGASPHVGTDDARGTYDNERPRHARDAAPFAIDRYPVTGRRYLEFVLDGGYADDAAWSPEGRDWRDAAGVTAPAGWAVDGRDVTVRRFGRDRALDPAAPVQHVSWHEADAFARWAGGRLPTEFEWEVAASAAGPGDRPARHPWGDAPPDATTANVGWLADGPLPAGSFPAGRSPAGVEQALGDVYEWTASEFDGYPGFVAYPYPEYSEVFFRKGYRVLRGASWAIAAPLVRTSYRNWDLPERRQLFAGLRVAWDVT